MGSTPAEHIQTRLHLFVEPDVSIISYNFALNHKKGASTWFQASLNASNCFSQERSQLI